MKKVEGITLIALIVTIIVLLILAGVSIMSLTGENGLLSKANLAKSKTAEANAKEIIELKVLGSYEKNGSLSIDLLNKNLEDVEGISGLPITQLPARVELDGVTVKISSDGNTNMIATEDIGISTTHDWTIEGETLTCKCNNCIKQNKEGISFTIGQQVDYTDTGVGTSSLSGEKSGVAQAISDGVLDASDFGTDGEQTITKNTNIVWLVLGKKDSDGDGINETLLITTEAPTTEKLTLYGGNPYYYSVDEELDRMCKEIYGENARSIDADDVNTALGYTPIGGIYFPITVGKYLQIGNFSTKISELTDNYYNLWDSKERSSILYSSSGEKRSIFYTPEYQNGTSNEEELGKYIVDGYWYLSSSEIENPYSLPVLPDTTSQNMKKLIFGQESDLKYFLADTGVGVYNRNCFFGIRKSSCW